MTDVTQVLSQIEQGDSGAANQLLPLVYDELRKLAAAKLAQEKPGQTLQATADWCMTPTSVLWAWRRLNIGTVAGIFLLRPQRRCGGSWWRTRGRGTP